MTYTPCANIEKQGFLDQKIKQELVKPIKKQINKFGLNNEDIAPVNTL